MTIKNTDALIDVKEVGRICGCSRTEIWRQVKAGKFPQPARLGARCTRYSLAEVSDWVQKRLAERAAA